MDKREFLKLSGVVAAGAVVAPALTFCGQAPKKEENSEPKEKESTIFELPALPYAFNALEPHIDARTMEIHHDKHHAGYTKKLNAALEDQTSFQGKSIEEILKSLDGSDAQNKLRNNAGGYYNHCMFWEIMAPSAGGAPSGMIGEAINSSFGSYEDFKSQFAKEASSVFGSGWAWLCKNESGKLMITSTPNQDNPLMKSIAEEVATPLMGIDVWEHAYYLNYQNKRGEYIDNFFNLINWDQVAKNLSNA